MSFYFQNTHNVNYTDTKHAHTSDTSHSTEKFLQRVPYVAVNCSNKILCLSEEKRNLNATLTFFQTFKYYRLSQCVCVFVMWNRFSFERHLMRGIKFVFFSLKKKERKKRNYLPINTKKLTVEDSYLHPD